MKEVKDKKMSLKTKIIAAISIIAALGAAVVLVIILVAGDSGTNPPGNDGQNGTSSEESSNGVSDYDQVRSYFTDIKGYWTSGNLFFAFKNKEGKHFIEYGLYGASYGETGEIKDAEVTGTNAFCLTVLIAAVPANAMNDGRPERTETVCIDVSNFEKENRLNVKLDNNYIGGREWHTYEYGGVSLEEAYKDGIVEEY